MAAEAEAQFSIGQVIPGTRYRVRGLIGSGGMGSVYEVEHEELGKLFVLKALRPQLIERRDLAARMKNEWHALGRLEHPNIIRVTDAGRTSDGVPYYVMERLTGETLAARLRREGPMSVPSAIRVATAILDALAAAHAIGVVHRDIKPQNVFLPSGGGIKLLDFGVAKLRDRAAMVVTRRGVAIGTPKYMSPEQAEGNAVDGRADLYAVGLVLFELVLGRGPFAHHREPNELVLAHIAEIPPRLDDVWSGVPAELADLVQRWLSKDPADRPLDAGIAARELGRLLERFGRELGVVAEVSTLGADYEATTRGPGSAPFGTIREAATAPTRTAADGTASTALDELGGCSEVTRTEERSRTPPPVVPSRAGRSRLLGWAQRGAWAGAAVGALVLGTLLAGVPLNGMWGGAGLTSVPTTTLQREETAVGAEIPAREAPDAAPRGRHGSEQADSEAESREPPSSGRPGPVLPTSPDPTSHAARTSQPNQPSRSSPPPRAHRSWASGSGEDLRGRAPDTLQPETTLRAPAPSRRRIASAEEAADGSPPLGAALADGLPGSGL